MNRRCYEHPICFSWGGNKYACDKKSLNITHSKHIHSNISIQQYISDYNFNETEIDISITCELLQATYELGVNNKDTIKDVKQKIQDLSKIPKCLQMLFYKNVGLGDNDTISKCNIQNKSNLKLGLKLHTAICPKCSMSNVTMSKIPSYLKINTLTGDNYEVFIPLSNPVEDLKRMLEEKYNIYPNHQIIVYEDRRLEDDIALMEYGIEEEATLLLVLYEFYNCGFCAGCAAAEGRDTIKLNFFRNNITWALHNEFTVREFKETTYKYLHHIHPDLQSISYKNRELRNDKTLKDYNIKGGSTLDVTLNFVGRLCDICQQPLLRSVY